MEEIKTNIWIQEKKRIIAIYSNILMHSIPYEVGEIRKLLALELSITKKEIELHDLKKKYINPRI